MTFTHKGWCGFCPIYLSDIYSNCPGVIARHPLLHPLLKLNIWLQECAIGFCTMINPEWTPVWKLRVTASLEE